MPTTQGVFTDRVRYSLLNKEFGSLIGIDEPLNWDDDDKTLLRSKTLHGIFPRFSNDITFIEDGARHIETIKRDFGINSQIIVVREERNPISLDDEWVVTYTGELDLTKYKREENGNVTVRFNSGGLEKTRKSRQNIKVELEAENTLDGDTLPDLDIKEVALNGRDVFLTSEVRQVESTEYNIRTSIAYFPGSGNYISQRREALSVKADLIYESDDQVNAVIYSPINIIPTSTTSLPTYHDGTTGNMFYAVATQNKTIKLKFDINFTITGIARTSVLGDCDLRIVLLKYKNGVNYDFDSRQVLAFIGNPANNSGNTYTYTGELDYNIQEDESLALVLEQEMDFVPEHSTSLNTFITVNKWQINIDEQSTSLPSRSNVVLAHEAGERILKMITGQDNIFYSTLLGGKDIGYQEDGLGRYAGLSHGYWVRGFAKGDNLYKSITTSWKDYYKSLDAIYNIGLGLETFQGKQRYVLEDKRYFYSRNVTIRLGHNNENGEFVYTQVSDVVRTVDDRFYFSDIEIGFAKGGEYEEVMGLDEYNVKSQFSTVIRALDNSYKRLSTYRGDSIGKEIARRASKSLSPTQDTPYDKDIFIQDLKRGEAQVLEERLWQDDLEEAPTGVFSPNTATNLKYTPFNCFLRHAWFVAGGLQKYENDFIRFANSISNSELVTNLKASLYPTYGGTARSENGDIRNGDIKGVRFFPEKVSFKYEVDFELNLLLNGTTNLPNGKTIPNLNGLIEYKNENGQIERAYLNKLKPNKGEWEVLIANF